jgi:D-alanyl-D-alanine-carboxypeptidase/D-alanyl-D-alanine-endopeptidase
MILGFALSLQALANPLVELKNDADAVELKGEGAGIVGLIVQGPEQSSFGTRPELDEQTPFEIGSVSKVFTSLLLSAAVDEGLLALEEPIGPQLQSSTWMTKPARPETAAITYKQLSTHQSGLDRLPHNIRLLTLLFNASDPYAKYDGEKLGKAVSKAKPASDGKMTYSNFGAGLLGQLVSDKFGLEYCDAIHQEISQPMGLESVVCEDSDSLATPHLWTGAENPPWHFQALIGAGGLRSNAADLGLFVQHHIDSARVPQLASALQRSTTAHSSKTGLGWMRKETDETVCWWHNGQTGGSASFVGFCPAIEFGVVLLMNETPLAHPLTEIGIEALQRALESSISSDQDAPSQEADAPEEEGPAPPVELTDPP